MDHTDLDLAKLVKTLINGPWRDLHENEYSRAYICIFSFLSHQGINTLVGNYASTTSHLMMGGPTKLVKWCIFWYLRKAAAAPQNFTVIREEDQRNAKYEKLNNLASNELT